MRSPDSGEHWGILGGAFDPVHFGHLRLAADLCDQVPYAGILFVPSYNPPRKRGGCLASFEDRLAMLRLAIVGEPRFALSDIEKASAEPGYTLLTVRALKKRFPKATFDFIIGADLLSELESWYEAEEIVKEVRIVAGSRPGAPVNLPARFPAGAVKLVPTTLVDLASRDIRSQLAQGLPVEELARFVPKSVAEYIREHGLYQ